VEETRESDRSIRAEMYRHQDSFFFPNQLPFFRIMLYLVVFLYAFSPFSAFLCLKKTAIPIKLCIF